eukprot:gb/GEZN01011675.1/.p1 GENE.gb/GEZN01011675.1/~~gb/GEZN01011675.1/.p1  ORF type:complete len:250 (-),score=14.48 gb/GEZN01011675.1/:365-1114(-)
MRKVLEMVTNKQKSPRPSKQRKEEPVLVPRPWEIRLGPMCGGKGGGEFSDLPALREVEEKYIEVSLCSVDLWYCTSWQHCSTPCLQSLQMHVRPRGADMPLGHEIPLTRHGIENQSWGYNDWKKITIKFEPGERITEFHYYKGPGYSIGMKLVTNKKDSGWIGMTPPSSRDCDCVTTPPDQQVVGFYGRIGAIVDSIGVIYQPRVSFEDLAKIFARKLNLSLSNDVLNIILLYVKKDLYQWDLNINLSK